MKFTFSLLNSTHLRREFNCGVQSLNDYLKMRASQDARHGYATIIIASSSKQPEKIAGFYTLSAASVDLGKLPEDMAKKLPRYPQIPASRLGRLAVDKSFQGNGLDTLLVMDAIRRCYINQLAQALLLVDTKDERARSFYAKMYFCPFQDNQLHMWMKRKQAEKLAELITLQKF